MHCLSVHCLSAKPILFGTVSYIFVLICYKSMLRLPSVLSPATIYSKIHQFCVILIKERLSVVNTG